MIGDVRGVVWTEQHRGGRYLPGKTYEIRAVTRLWGGDDGRFPETPTLVATWNQAGNKLVQATINST